MYIAGSSIHDRGCSSTRRNVINHCGASAETLADHYRFLRRVSESLRLFGARPTDTLEVAGPMPTRLAKSLEYPSRKELLEEYRRRTAWVRALYDRVVPR